MLAEKLSACRLTYSQCTNVKVILITVNHKFHFYWVDVPTDTILDCCSILVIFCLSGRTVKSFSNASANSENSGIFSENMSYILIKD